MKTLRNMMLGALLIGSLTIAMPVESQQMTGHRGANGTSVQSSNNSSSNSNSSSSRSAMSSSRASSHSEATSGIGNGASVSQRSSIGNGASVSSRSSIGSGASSNSGIGRGASVNSGIGRGASVNSGIGNGASSNSGIGNGASSNRRGSSNSGIGRGATIGGGASHWPSSGSNSGRNTGYGNNNNNYNNNNSNNSNNGGRNTGYGNNGSNNNNNGGRNTGYGNNDNNNNYNDNGGRNNGYGNDDNNYNNGRGRGNNGYGRGNGGYYDDNYGDYGNYRNRDRQNEHSDRFYWNYSHNDWRTPMPPPMRQYRPDRIRFYRPVISSGFSVWANAPIIDGALGLLFGTNLDATLNYLYYKGYDIDGYTNSEVYLRDVPYLRYMWSDVMLNFQYDGQLTSIQFYYSNSGRDVVRYNRIYRDMCSLYGNPCSVRRGALSGTTTWMGSDMRGYVTLTLDTDDYGRYYTAVTYAY
jgi:hypothetical protein